MNVEIRELFLLIPVIRGARLDGNFSKTAILHVAREYLTARASIIEIGVRFRIVSFPSTIILAFRTTSIRSEVFRV